MRGELAREVLPESAPKFALIKRVLPPSPKRLPAAPASCRHFISAKPAANVAACSDRAATLQALESALAETAPQRRDALLKALETCATLPAGLVLSLRAELAPVKCADSLLRPFLSRPPAGLDGAIYDALFGQALAGMLSRAATEPPRMLPPHDKERVAAFIKKTMAPWVRAHAIEIEKLARLGSRLRFYGKAIAAVEAGMAEMRFVEVFRSVPVPTEYRDDQELRETYLSSLEVAMDPRKRRGRDAALVGLGSLATVGVIVDPRVERARSMLAKLYGGAPMNALDPLLLPPLPALPPVQGAARLAVRLPTFYAGLLLPPSSHAGGQALRLLLERGLPLSHRIALAKQKLGPAERLLVARARLEMGQRYWRRVDFDEATRLLAQGVTSDEGRLLWAVSLALHGGPDNAASMMLQAPLLKLGVGRVAALDELAAEGGPWAGAAAFNGALLRQLATPPNASAKHWRELAQRYQDAAMLLDGQARRDSKQRARGCQDTAAAIEEAAAAPAEPSAPSAS